MPYICVETFTQTSYNEITKRIGKRLPIKGEVIWKSYYVQV